jgi:hypothetical protein
MFMYTHCDHNPWRSAGARTAALGGRDGQLRVPPRGPVVHPLACLALEVNAEHAPTLRDKKKRENDKTKTKFARSAASGYSRVFIGEV